LTKRNPTTQSTKSASGNAPVLSSGAYFPADTTKPRISQKFEWFKEMRRANRVKRGNAPSKQYRMDVHADMLKVRRSRVDKGLPEYPVKGGGIRGRITRFSPASRKRMIEFMASIRSSSAMLFVTLTYDDDSYLRAIGKVKNQLENLRKRFERKYPTWRAFWRVETKTRKSGMLKGTPVPHFHMIVFTDRSYDEDEIGIQAKWFASWGIEAWSQITGSTNPHNRVYGFHVEPVRSRRHAYHYVAKYLSKTDDELSGVGRRWGRIGNFDTSPSQTICLDEEEIIIIRRLIKRWLKNRNRGFSQRFARYSPLHGFSVFGCGDEQATAAPPGIAPSFEQFIFETRRQVEALNGYQMTWNS